MVHQRFAPPNAKMDLALARQVAAGYGEALRSSVPTLIAQLEAERAKREADRGPEPTLAANPARGTARGDRPLRMID